MVHRGGRLAGRGRRRQGQPIQLSADDMEMGVEQAIPLELRLPTQEVIVLHEEIRGIEIVPERTFSMAWPHGSRLYTDVSMIVDRMRWRYFCTNASRVNLTLVREFYANLREDMPDTVMIRGVEVRYGTQMINDIYALENVEDCEFQRRLADPNVNRSINTYADILCTQGHVPVMSSVTGLQLNMINHLYLDLRARIWQSFIASRITPTSARSDVTIDRAILIACILEGWKINVGRIIFNHIRAGITRMRTQLGFGSLITSLCVRSGVPRAHNDEIISAGSQWTVVTMRSFMDSIRAVNRTPLNPHTQPRMPDLPSIPPELNPQPTLDQTRADGQTENEPDDERRQSRAYMPPNFEHTTEASSSTSIADVMKFLHSFKEEVFGSLESLNEKFENLNEKVELNCEIVTSLKTQVNTLVNKKSGKDFLGNRKPETPLHSPRRSKDRDSHISHIRGFSRDDIHSEPSPTEHLNAEHLNEDALSPVSVQFEDRIHSLAKSPQLRVEGEEDSIPVEDNQAAEEFVVMTRTKNLQPTTAAESEIPVSQVPEIDEDAMRQELADPMEEPIEDPIKESEPQKVYTRKSLRLRKLARGSDEKGFEEGIGVDFVPQTVEERSSSIPDKHEIKIDKYRAALPRFTREEISKVYYEYLSTRSTKDQTFTIPIRKFSKMMKHISEERNAEADENLAKETLKRLADLTSKMIKRSAKRNKR